MEKGSMEEKVSLLGVGGGYNTVIVMHLNKQVYINCPCKTRPNNNRLQ